MRIAVLVVIATVDYMVAVLMAAVAWASGSRSPSSLQGALPSDADSATSPSRNAWLRRGKLDQSSGRGQRRAVTFEDQCRIVGQRWESRPTNSVVWRTTVPTVKPSTVPAITSLG